MPVGGLIVGVDLSPIKSIPKVITFQSDITTDKCRATIRSHLKTWKADTVLHDGAPNVGTAWVQDSFNQAELALQAMKLATEFLVEGGTFVTKVFRSKDYNPLLWVFNQLFTKVEATKPPSSRSVSAEIFIVCRGYKAPKKLDPKFLDPRSVFADLTQATPNNEAKVYHPELKKRKREGYEDGNYTQFKEAPASEFIETIDPIAMLASYNKFTFNQTGNGDIALAALDRLPETTTEIRLCCGDLKVLGKKEFRLLLKWRLKVRDILGFASAKAEEQEETAEIEPLDEELQNQQVLERLNEKVTKKKKNERRKENEKKQKEIFRMQMHMITPMEIGMEHSAPTGEDSMFNLKPVDKAGATHKIAHGRMATIVQEPPKPQYEEEEMDTDSDGDGLEGHLDSMYAQYQEKKSASDAKYRAKKARGNVDEEEWHGISDHDTDEELSEDEKLVEDDQSDSSDDELSSTNLLTDLEKGGKSADGLSKRAAQFFDQDIFNEIAGMHIQEEDEDSGIEVEGSPDESIAPMSGSAKFKEQEEETILDSDSDSDFEVIKEPKKEDVWDEAPEPMKNGRLDIDIITAEAMTLAHQLATGVKTKADLIDDNFHRYSFRDVDGLPEWFLDDENQHAKIQRPITAAAASAIKEKTRALNARPIKKVMEAKARKKMRAARRLEKLKKKSAVLLEDEGLTEADKAKTVSQLMAKAGKAKPKRGVKLVVARGGNRGISGRPKGTKGRYKMVDSRMKKDIRADKRLKKKIAGK